MAHVYPNRVVLANNISADGSAVTVDGGQYVLLATATWAGGSVAVHILLPDGSSYAAIPSVTLSANGYYGPVYIPSGATVKLVRTGSPTAIRAVLDRVPV